MKALLKLTCVALGLSAAWPATAFAQSPTEDEQAVLATLDRLFDGMRANDGELAQSAFADGAVLIRTEGGDGAPATSISPVTGLVSAVAGATVEWDEPVWDPIVHIQDHLATVWIKYAFYLDGTFSHCGVDAVLFARGADGWKITALSDSRETEACELPPGRGR